MARPGSPTGDSMGYVLLAEDDAETRSDLTGILRRHWRVRAVPDGAEALSAARERRPDLVLADVTMPGLDGFQLLQQLRAEKRTEAVPVVFLSGRSEEEDVVKGLRAGANDYIVKPFSDSELIARVQATLAVTRLRDALEATVDQLRVEVASRERLLAIVSHDLKNPMTSILLETEQLLKNAPTDRRARGRKQAEAIHRSASRMNRLVNDLLDFSKSRSGELGMDCAVQQASDLLREALEVHKAVADEKRILLREEDALGSALIECDADRMTQVFSNLIGNAIKFTPAGGLVTVRAEPQEENVRFSVTDTGPGIAADLLPYVFEPYRQGLATERRGLGLGLFISKRIVEAHGGRIWAEVPPQGGARLSFTLPCVKSSPDA